MQADIKNKNGRVYPMEILDKEVKRYNKEFINEKRAYGELGHPEGPTINLERASHMITALYPDGKNFIGKLKYYLHLWVKSLRPLWMRELNLVFLQEEWEV